MLWKTVEMKQMSIVTPDGTAGKVEQFLIDDRNWSIRYIVVDTGPGLHVKRVILSPVAVTDVKYNKILINSTIEQIRNSPDIDTTQPVSRQMEEELHKYYAWAFYWLYPEGYNSLGGGIYPGLSLPYMYPAASGNVPLSESDLRYSHVENSPGSSHLRLSNEIISYQLHASDGDIGHIDDFIVDDSQWIIKYVVADTRNFFPGRKILISPVWVSKTDWTNARVHVVFDRKTIRESPGYNPELPITPEYELRLAGYYSPENERRQS
jgi:hypothetical protein